MAELLPDIGNLRDQLDTAERDARMLVENLAEERGCWRPEAGSWSVTPNALTIWLERTTST